MKKIVIYCQALLIVEVIRVFFRPISIDNVFVRQTKLFKCVIIITSFAERYNLENSLILHM